MFGKDALCYFMVLIYFKAFDENDKKTDNLIYANFLNVNNHPFEDVTFTAKVSQA